MSYFPWTDEMVNEICNTVLTLYGHSNVYYKNYIAADIEKYKEEKIKQLQGTFENKIYWAVNEETLDIRPIGGIPPLEEGDRYFVTYPEAEAYSRSKHTMRLKS